MQRHRRHRHLFAALSFLGISGAVWFCAVPMAKRAGAGEHAPPDDFQPHVGGSAARGPIEADEVPPDVEPSELLAPARDVLRARDPQTGERLVAAVHAAPSIAPRTASRALDDQEDSAWVGESGVPQWHWGVTFRAPVHLAVIRAHFGGGSPSGIPTTYRWEVRPPRPGQTTCAATPGKDDGYVPVRGADEVAPPPKPGAPPAPPTALHPEPTHRSWFVDADACALRLVIDKTNSGPPIVREVYAFEGARDVLREATAKDDGAAEGFSAAGAIDGTYEGRWEGAPGKEKWTLEVDLPEPEPIDRVRLVLGFDAVGRPRGVSPEVPGRDYAIAYGPLKYTLEATEDGKTYFTIAKTPLRQDRSVLPLRRRLVTLPHARTIRALRLVMDGASGPNGVPDPMAMPVVREIAAYRADDPRRVIPPPWILSVNANPPGQSHKTRWGEVANDIYFTKYLQLRFARLIPSLRDDDRFSRALGPRGELMEAPPNDAAGEVLEAIEGDDPSLDEELLAKSNPPPITVLSGSNDWDYGVETGPDAKFPVKWHWDPLRDASEGGMGRLHRAVKDRAAPFLGFCGGAQILGLLEAKPKDDTTREEDQEIIDAVVRRTTGRPIRGFAPKEDVDAAWPGDSRPRVAVTFEPREPLFRDIADTERPEDAWRRATHAFPESHVDVIRPDAFLPGGALQRFEMVAHSEFCASDVVAGGPHDPATPNPNGPGSCNAVTEAYRTREDARFPIIATQFHPEQRDFPNAAPGDPPESVADPRLFVAAAYEEIVTAYLTAD